MPGADLVVLLGLGVLFLLLGVGAFIWDKLEKNRYYNSISGRSDVREYVERRPYRPQFGALKTGGWIAVAVGVVLLAIASASWLWG